MQDSTYRMISALRMRHFELLSALAETGSMRAAGERLSVSTAAVSKSLLEIESMLGVELFRRHAKGVSATATGDVLVHRARLLLSEVSNLADDLRDRKLGHAPVLRIGCPPFIAWTLLPALLGHLGEVASLPPVHIEEGRLDHTQQQLQSGEIDVLLTMNTSSELGRLCQEGLVIHPICHEAWIAVCAPGHAAARQTPNACGWSWQDLRRHAWILPPRPTQARSMLDQLLLSENMAPIAPAIESTNAITNLKLAQRGHGVTLMAARTVADSLRDGTLVQLPLAAPPAPIPIVLVYRAGTGQAGMIARFHAAALAVLQRESNAAKASGESNKSPSKGF